MGGLTQSTGITRPANFTALFPIGTYWLPNPANGALISVVAPRPTAESMGFLRWCDDVADAYDNYTNQTIGTASGTVTLGIWADSVNGNDGFDGLAGNIITLGIGSSFTVSTLTLTKTNGFANVSAGDIIYLKAGLHVVVGYYTIITKTNNNNVVLDRSCSDNGSNLTTLTASSGPVKTLKGVQTLHDAWNGSGVLGIYFKRGGIWQGFSTTTGGSDATQTNPRGLVLGHKWNGAKVICRDYGSAAQPCPRLTVFNTILHASFSKTATYTNIYEYATTDNVAWVRHNLNIGGYDVYLKFDASGTTATNLTAMDAVPGTWYYDNTAHKLYVHAYWSIDPTVADFLEYVTQNDTNASGAVGDGIAMGDQTIAFSPNFVRLENITVEGYGCQVDAFGQNGNGKANYAIHGYLGGNSVGYIKGCTAIYCQRHSCTNTWGGAGGGGIWVVDNCQVGCTVGDGGQIIGYAGDGNPVVIARENRIVAGWLYKQSLKNAGQGYGLSHTDGVAGHNVQLALGIRNYVMPGPCQAASFLAASQIPTFTTSDDCVCFCVGDVMEVRDSSAFDSTGTRFTNNSIEVFPISGAGFINCRFKASQPAVVDPSFGWQLTPISFPNATAPGFMYNCDIEVNGPRSVPIPNTSYVFDQCIHGFNNENPGLYYGCRFHWINTIVTSGAMFNGYFNGAPSGKIAASILTTVPPARDKDDRNTYPHFAVSWKNSASNLLGNAYYGLGEVSDASAGYDQDANKLELGYVPVGNPDSKSPLIRTLLDGDKPFGRRLEYDINGIARSSTMMEIGPYAQQ